MKEQLANMTIIELVTTAHSYATSIQQIDTYSAIVTEMASRLEALNLAHIGGMNSLRSAISDRDRLAAENAALKECRDSYAPAIDLWNRWADAEDKIPPAPETPATDAFLREQMAKGVEAFARSLRGEAEITKACTFKPVQQFEEFAARADEIAAKLRNGEAV